MVGTKYKPPLNGRESHMSGMEIIEKKAYDAREKTRLDRLKAMKSCIDNKPPPKFTHILSNRKKQMQDVDRFSEIERENYRLLARMSSIMTHQHMEDYIPPLCPALDKMRQRTRTNRQVAGENAILMQRINKVKSHYDAAEWRESMVGHDHALMYLCKYPRVLAPLSDAGVWEDETTMQSKGVSRQKSILSTARSKSAMAGNSNGNWDEDMSQNEDDNDMNVSNEDNSNNNKGKQRHVAVRPETSIGMTRDLTNSSINTSPVKPKGSEASNKKLKTQQQRSKSADPGEFENHADSVSSHSSSHDDAMDDGFSPPSKPHNHRNFDENENNLNSFPPPPGSAPAGSISKKSPTPQPSQPRAKTRASGEISKISVNTSYNNAMAAAIYSGSKNKSPKAGGKGVLGGEPPVVRESLRELRKRKQKVNNDEKQQPQKDKEPQKEEKEEKIIEEEKAETTAITPTTITQDEVKSNDDSSAVQVDDENDTTNNKDPDAKSPTEEAKQDFGPSTTANN